MWAVKVEPITRWNWTDEKIKAETRICWRWNQKENQDLTFRRKGEMIPEIDNERWTEEDGNIFRGEIFKSKFEKILGRFG